jgi:hypothetical protein
VIVINEDTSERQKEIRTKDIDMLVVIFAQLEGRSFSAKLEAVIRFLDGGVFAKQCINSLWNCQRAQNKKNRFPTVVPI